MHQPQNPPDVAFVGQDRHENLARGLGVLINFRDLPKAAADHIFHLRAQTPVILLRELKNAHHQQRIVVKDVALFRVQLLISHQKRFDVLALGLF